MNVKNNRLGRETDERIIRAVYAMMTREHRPIGKITVREICERTGVHRSTFYAHYQDVYDLVERVEKSMSRQLTEAFSGGWTRRRRPGTALWRSFLSSGSTGSFTPIILPRAKATACCSWPGRPFAVGRS